MWALVERDTAFFETFLRPDMGLGSHGGCLLGLHVYFMFFCLVVFCQARPG